MASEHYIHVKWEQRPEYLFKRYEIDKRLYEDESRCRTELFELLCGQNFQCPDCHARKGWMNLSSRKCYSCKGCKRHLYPLSFSIFRKKKISPIKLFKILNSFDPRETNAAMSKRMGINPSTAAAYLNIIKPIFGRFEEKYIEELYSRCTSERHFHHDFLLWWHEFFFLNALDKKYEELRGRKAPNDWLGAYFLRNLPF